MILLDTHAAVWAVTDSPRLGAQARTAIRDARQRYVSSLTHVEIAIKRAKGKFPIAPGFANALNDHGLVDLPFAARHAAGVEALVGQITGDPFDWMILAQARVEALTLITADRRLLTFDNTVDASR